MSPEASASRPCGISLKAGEIKPTYPVPCKVANGDIDPVEISLLENVLRENMHPADEFEAFRDLVDKGVPLADIAARFGVTENRGDAAPETRPRQSRRARRRTAANA